ncbi:MAG: hypothetical protein KBD26_01250 [Candidatus Pacebacteria bacterium]|nr:hypothetical protein [Candidatus Paceibacterota bacterium]MBP9772435.1 hypothetical protein [Candidatus Paceibacterota bacterium]QQR76476.1 MAG: hypothetical protein IPJ63_03195 [Candidatus Nomurabacteria bacterium]
MATTTFKPKQVTKKILSPLQDRAYDVIISRFGLDDSAERKTLEAIGEIYGITRERVRQIENAALQSVRKSDSYKEHAPVFSELRSIIEDLGGVVSEDELLSNLSKDKSTQNHFHLYLVLGDEFTKHKEDEHFKSRWSVDNDTTDKVHDSLKKLYTSLKDEELIPESDLIEKFLDYVKDISAEYRNEEIARRWLSISKTINKNPLGEWGKADSSNVKTRGIKDYAFLMMRKNGEPMHFREVADAICKTFGKKTHVATCHNELIKDSRFVLVGRGKYALKEWGYKPGVVKDVIKEILKKEGPLSKDEVVEKVMKERFLKKNTILVNLQNPKYFKKNKQGLYTPV